MDANIHLTEGVMREIITGVIASIIAAAILGFIALFWRRVVTATKPVSTDITPIVPDEWFVVFPGSLPQEAYDIEGRDYQFDEVYRLLRGFGAVDAGETSLRLTIRGLSDQTIVIRNIQAKVEHRSPYGGTCIHCPTAGSNEGTLLVFNLDDELSEAWEWREGDSGREIVSKVPFFRHNNITLTKGEVHDFILVGIANRYLCQWVIHLNIEIGNIARTIILGDDADNQLITSGEPQSGFKERLDWAWYDGKRFIQPPSSN